MLSSNIIQSMETKLQEACHAHAKLDDVIQCLDSLLSEYELTSHGPGKWQKLAAFLQKCLEGPLLDLFRRRLNQIESERSALKLKCSSSEDKLGLLKMQLEANERHRTEYLKRYEQAISDKEKISKDYSARILDLQSKYSKLEERCSGLLKALDLAKFESFGWKSKFDHTFSEQKAEEDKLKAQLATLESRINASEGRVAAVREQAQSAQEEASEWKRKYDIAVGEAKTALERAALVQERSNKKAQEREDSLRADFADQIAEKEREIANLTAKTDLSANHENGLVSQLEAAESKLKDQEAESLALNNEIKTLVEEINSVTTMAQSHEKQVKILEQEKNHLEERCLSECKKFSEADKRCKDAEREAKRAVELADSARAEVVASQKEKNEAQQLAMERLTVIERTIRQVESLERERTHLMDELVRLRQSEMDAISKVTSLEGRVNEREREIEEMLSQNNAQRSNTVQVLESLLATERAALAVANNRAEVLSLQLQATQGKLDALQQELTSVRLNETALDGKLRTAHGKRLRLDDCTGAESVHNIDVDQKVGRGRKRSKSTTSPYKYASTEDGGSVFIGEEERNEGEEERNESEDNHSIEAKDYAKFTVLKLKQELTKHGFGAQLLQLKSPNKKDIMGLYEKHVLKK